jgi:recombination protein RecA
MLFLMILSFQVAPPFKTVEFDIIFGSGIDKFGCLVDAAELCEVVSRKGSYYYLDGTQLAQGRALTIEKLKVDASLTSDIDKRVREKMKAKDLLTNYENEEFGFSNEENNGADFSLSEEDSMIMN